MGTKEAYTEPNGAIAYVLRDLGKQTLQITCVGGSYSFGADYLVFPLENGNVHVERYEPETTDFTGFPTPEPYPLELLNLATHPTPSTKTACEWMLEYE